MPASAMEAPQESEQKTVQLLIFAIAGEEYAVGLTEVQEIIPTPEITPVPNMPESVRGVANLRGRVVTAIDIKKLFGIETEIKNKSEHIIVAEKDDYLFGLLVETAEEVLRVPQETLKKTPELLKAHPHANYLKGVIVIEEGAEKDESGNKETTEQSRIILTLDLDKILSDFSSINNSISESKDKDSETNL